MVNVRKLLENSNITAAWPGLAARLRFDEPMRLHTTFKIGGPADCFAEPENSSELVALLDFAREAGVPVSVIGGGSNLLVADRGIRGLVVSLARLCGVERVESGDSVSVSGKPLPSLNEQSVIVRSGAGASMEALVAWCADRGIAGLERFAGLPGSVGGAAYMNARCYERSVSDVFFLAEVLCFRDGRYRIEEKAYIQADWDYKKSPFQKRNGVDQARIDETADILLSVSFRLSLGDVESIRSQMAAYVKDRECKGHFRFPSAGSMFKNNHAFGKPSGKIIDDSGLRGFRVGDAQVAPWHGNIVINAGNATAAEVKALVDEVRARVRALTGFELEPEVIMAGDWE
ncbi:MAG TPA: UDP-N-acetylmuramate dehydrogenase [Treponemataceae bacterium]|nr:UDP-N-acetylmuramate dehydrogenase [Treponemataceae bacterium]HPS44978.1 UDP-N-acetylmuramate dehydrogenase [Treponemataceae bacterium]